MDLVGKEPGILQIFRARMRVMSALMIRELHTRFGRENLGYVWLFLEPALLGLGVAVWQWSIGVGSSMKGDLNKFSFFLIGYILYYLFRTLVSRSPHGIAANYQLLYHSRVTVEAVMWARSVLDAAAVAICIAIFVLIIGIVFGDWPSNPLQMMAGVLLMMLLSHGTGLIFLASTALNSQLVDRLVHPFTYLCLPFSGMFFMVWWLPGSMQELVLWFPLIHIMEFTREGQFGPRVPYSYNLTYTLIWILGVNFIGLCALKAAKPHLEV
ncbi:ABC transporter permease [Sediminicoccus rosea]|jgi:capsular polysaccharide transport system permease protein|uniref:ABC transporter permease n=1 Tax=Sediminicoccus rosea TaxID=1225128 RepID=A0ABZ0PHW9_9PROT|nr:ABC transporter permease [Sediminicoccus rosea]WPB85046.1 ABC transporter permease [Sediminicoccus rosea]